MHPVIKLFIIQIVLHSIVLSSVSSYSLSQAQLDRFSRRQLTREHYGLFSKPPVTAVPAINKYKYIPLNNSRIHQITLLNDNPDPEMREEKYIQLQEKILLKKKPIIEDLRTVQELELQLLDMGIYAICRWEKTLPAPLDADEQCSEEELKFFLNNNSAFTSKMKNS